MDFSKSYLRIFFAAISSLGLVACQGGGGGNNSGGNAPARSGSGVYKSCMISVAKNNAASEYSTMCFNIPEDSSDSVCDNGVFGGEYTDNSTGTERSGSGGNDTNESETQTNQRTTNDTSETEQDTTETNVVEDNFNKRQQSSLKLADEDSSGSKLHFRPNANFCQIIKPLANACATNIDGTTTNVYFSSLDVTEAEAANLCASTIGGSLKAIDISTTTPSINGPDIDNSVTNDPDNKNPNDTNKDDPDNSVTAPSGLAASLAAKVKDCGDSNTPSEYCGAGKLGNGPRFTFNNPGSEIQHGFVESATKRLIVVTGPHLDESGLLPTGVSYTPSVMAVDLETGDRSVISGLKN